MPSNTKTPAPARKIPNLRLHAQDPETRLVRTVLASERLLGVLPQDELDALCTAHAAAEAAVVAARELPVAGDNIEAELDAAHRAGKPTDVAELVARFGAAQAARDHHAAAVRLLGTFPGRYTDDIIRLIVNHTAAFYGALQDDLDALLDRAEPIVTALDGVSSADEAFDKGKADEWAQLRTLTREYHDLRQEHFNLLRSEDLTNFAPGSPRLAAAMFAGISSVIPDLASREKTADLMGRPLTLPFPVYATDDVAHLLAAVRQRSALQPYVGTPEDAGDAELQVRLGTAGVPAVRGPDGELVTARPERSISARDLASMYRRAANAGFDKIAEEREDRARGIIPD
jgi:hypothetical protein